MERRPQLVKPYRPIAKKWLGQHFLRDEGVINRIVHWVQPSVNDIIIEIGAGDGSISSPLAAGISRFVAIELDPDCIPRLAQALKHFPHATVVAGDIMELDLAKLILPHMKPDSRLRIVGNLPYNIASAIIERMLHLELPVTEMFFMLQLEVAQRILAQPGSRRYGYLSVLCRHHADVCMGFKVPPSCFVPRPRVSSATVSFKPKPRCLKAEVHSSFEALAKAAFAYRRKTLVNSLARHPRFGRIANDLLACAGIDCSRRAESLSIQEYEHLAQVFHDRFSSTLN